MMRNIVYRSWWKRLSRAVLSMQHVLTLWHELISVATRTTELDRPPWSRRSTVAKRYTWSNLGSCPHL